MATSIMWFRRDLRLADNPALLSAFENGDDVLGLFLLDGNLRKPAGTARLAFLYRNLRALDESMDGNLVVRSGDPARTLLAVAHEVGAEAVYCAEDFGPYGRKRDEEVEAALAAADVELRRVGSNYAVPPGEIVNKAGTPFKVFTPFFRAWQAHGWDKPAAAPRKANWATAKSDGIPEDPKVDADLPKAGEKAAHARLDNFIAKQVAGYEAHRDEPAAGATSRLSPYLKYGLVHPRQVLAKLGRSSSENTFRSEICWREFYADVLFHNPESARRALNESMVDMKLDTGKKANERLAAWQQGLTGYPIVDAGMRQLMGEAWVHNRVRMIVASFLIKDLHIDWTLGARHFLDLLVDGDLASNNHGWQWVAGTGTDAAPYFRVFNPVTQGKKFDKQGDYIRKWVPELRDLDTKYVHEPWLSPDGLPDGYPERIVDHDTERKEALARYHALR